MHPFTTHTGVGVPLRRGSVDTDQIIPAVFMKRVTRTGFEDALFHSWRSDPAFVLNVPAFSGGSVLVAGPDFGIGSSREHAVWALCDHGFRAVISPRFGDIFRGNAGKAGLLAATASEETVELLWKVLDNAPGTTVTVDLLRREVSSGDGTVLAPIGVDDYTRWRLLEGLDDISLTLRSSSAIDDFESSRPAYKPHTLPEILHAG